MCGHGELLAVPRQWDTTLCMRVQGIRLRLKQWHGCCVGTMWKVSSGCEHDVGQGRARRDRSWVGVGAKSDVDSLCDAGVPWKHLERHHMLRRAQNLRVARHCRRGAAVSRGVRSLERTNIAVVSSTDSPCSRCACGLPHVCTFHPHPSKLSGQHTMSTAPPGPSLSRWTRSCVQKSPIFVRSLLFVVAL